MRKSTCPSNRLVAVTPPCPATLHKINLGLAQRHTRPLFTTSMFTPTAAPRHLSSDPSFFSKSKSSKPGASNTSPVTVTTRVVTVQRAPDPRPDVTARSATPASSSSTPGLEPAKKRKLAQSEARSTNAKRQRVSSSNASPANEALAKSRGSSSTPSSRSSGSSRQDSLSRSPMPLKRSLESRSRSTSVFDVPEASEPRECWIEEDGRPGPGFLTSEVVVRDLMKTYKAFFSNPHDPEDKSFEPHPTDYPVAELEYPNTGASERYTLLAPKDKDHYNPIMCLESTLHTIVKCYLTPTQQALFGTLPSTNIPDEDGPHFVSPALPVSIICTTDNASSPAVSATTDLMSPPSSAGSPSSSTGSPSSALSDSTYSSSTSLSSGSSTSSLSSILSLSSLSELSCYASQTMTYGPPTVNYLRLLRRAINKHDGPLFLKVMTAINAILRSLKYPQVPMDPFEPSPPNYFRQTTKTWTSIPKEIIMRIIEETYQRAVGPHVSTLNRYEAFSSEVYGELMPSFVSQIIQATGLNADSLLVDLGSGVGNVVLQASLQTGCKSFGVEIMPAPAKIARSQLEQFRMRCRMWGVTMGEVELEEGDMLKSRRVDELVSKADVVLVNNKVFLESLNEALRPKFLDLKEGAIVVSLKPFVSSLRVTERNLDDISSIFQVQEKQYHPGSVSWGNGGGSYFLHRVDREGYADIKQHFEKSRTVYSRSTRSRR
ncbi:hypothetical protein AcW1_000145 [Taiwanofungus camphoratus]|nr:hypothetical protein AcW1_000145 [Antrodia cinnamomea]